jgi:hypothetical protein
MSESTYNVQSSILSDTPFNRTKTFEQDHSLNQTVNHMSSTTLDWDIDSYSTFCRLLFAYHVLWRERPYQISQLEPSTL